MIASNTKHGYGAPSWNRVGKLVTLSGLAQLKSGAWGLVGTLPAKARPDRRLVFDANAHTGRVRVDVAKNGQIIVSPKTGKIGAGWVSLSGITYSTSSGTALTLTGGAVAHSTKVYGGTTWSQSPTSPSHTRNMRSTPACCG